MPCISASGKSRTVDDATERRIEEAIAAYRAGEYKHLKKASVAFDVPYHTFMRRFHGETAPRKQAHINQLLLSPAQEAALVDWVKYLGLTGHAVNKRTISPKVEAMLTGANKRRISKSWIRRFIARHPDLKLARGSGLDPKCARAFNFPTVSHHFELLKNYLEEHDIPWENVYNMDEKGIQLGGGRKGSRRKSFYSRTDKAQY
jgi:hypothetical protein